MNPSKPKCIVLLSGGLDSTTVLAIAKQEFEIYALSFDYGQRHKFELAAAELASAELAAAAAAQAAAQAQAQAQALAEAAKKKAEEEAAAAAKRAEEERLAAEKAEGERLAAEKKAAESDVDDRDDHAEGMPASRKDPDPDASRSPVGFLDLCRRSNYVLSGGFERVSLAVIYY